MTAVQILGAAPNRAATPDSFEGERWCMGNPRVVPRRFKETYTRWFNLHTNRHMSIAYPLALDWYALQTKPIYLQSPHPSISTSLAFPHREIQGFFSINGAPFTYFTSSPSWLIAFAIMLGAPRIELYGFELKRDRDYDFERPCFFYWLSEAHRRGIETYLPPDVEISPPGDPSTYSGPLYGYQPHSPSYKRTF